MLYKKLPEEKKGEKHVLEFYKFLIEKNFGGKNTEKVTGNGKQKQIMTKCLPCFCSVSCAHGMTFFARTCQQNAL